MEIIWFGQACFLIKSKKIRIVTDPYSQEIGLKIPKNLKADIVTISHEHPDHNNLKAVLSAPEEPFVLKGPGEYEVNNIEILGIPSFHDNQKGNLRGKNTIYLFRLEDLVLCHLGDLGHILSDEELEKFNQVDILFVPVGGPFLEVKKAIEIINQIEPKFIIPMHYQIEGLSLSLNKVDKFLKEMGTEPEFRETLKITKNELPEERKIIVLAKKN